ncbi:uncharacterized protein LOC110461307 [Mizuhopecten yessoensis]|uniref:uncharacterized protein LOC110461307 n=1 Tax=Mizuhopecten yessoensis TaxID=6573 RepID=UPI000B45CFFA|nr:uncharacterized protein LOC110461307 [Mizuhopecten yessoensis]
MTAITERASPRHLFVIQEQLKSQITSHVHEAKTVIKDFKETKVKLETEDAILKIANSILSVGHIIENETSSAPVQNALARIEENINILKQKPDVSLLEYSVSSSDMLDSLIISRPLEDVGSFDSMTATTRKLKSVTNAGLWRDTRFTGGTYLPDDRLLLADNNNGKIVKYDNEYNMINTHQLQNYPADIAYSAKHKVVLVMTHKDIQQYTINSDDLKYVSASPFPPQSRSTYLSGIAVHDDTILLGTDNSVYMLAMDGTEQKRIPRNGLFSCVAVCSELGRFCYPHENKVVCCKMDGTEIFRYCIGNIGCIRGLSFDRSGNIYVGCDGLSDAVHQILWDGQRGRDLLLDQSYINKSFYVMYHPSEDMLLVTAAMLGVHNNVKFGVFELGDFTK